MQIPTRSVRRRLPWLGLGACLAVTVSAQTAARSPAEETVVLSEFTVRAEPSDSYTAAETITGSRVAEKISNLPYPVNVLTSEFIDDFGFFDFGDDFAYTSSFGGYDPGGGGANVRGLAVGKSLRNGFLRIGVVDRANIDRIEVIKGPSAAVYGEALPSGLINIVTKKPKFRPGYRLSLTGGTNDLGRVDLEATGPLSTSGRTAYLINASYLEQGFDQPYAQLRTKVLSGVITHRFSSTTTLSLEAEYIDRHNCPIAAVPVARRTVGGTYHGRLATEIAGSNWYGPAESTNRTVRTVTATFEHKFSPIWSMRAAANGFDRDVSGRNSNVTGGVAPHYQVDGANAGKLIDRLPAFGSGTENGAGFQADLTARYWLASRQLENRTLLTFDWSTYERQDPQWRAAAGTALNNSGFGRIWDPKNPNYTWPTPEQFPTLYTLNRWNKNRTDITGLFLRHQTAAWRGRAIVVAGLRYDLVEEDLRRETEARLGTGPVSTLKREQDHLTPNVGINVGVTKKVRAYLNYAESFFVNSQTNSAPVLGGTVDPVNEGGFGWDYGFKAGFFEEKLTFTLGGFYIVRENIRVTDEDGNSRRIGSILSRGVELDANWSVVDGLNVLFGGGYNNASYTEAGQDLDQIGRQMAAVPKKSAYLAVRKTWKAGMLKGFKVNVGLTYTGETHPFPDRGGIVTTLPGGRQAILSHSGYRDILIPSYMSTRAGVAYSWRTTTLKLNHSLAATFTNLLDDDYLERNRRVVESFGAALTYTVKY
jgi:iron complex outermembrane recepter protein